MDTVNIKELEQRYSQVGARVALSDSGKGWDLSLYGKNLTDKIYVVKSFQTAAGVFICNREALA